LLGKAGPDTTWQDLVVLAALCGASAGGAAWLVSRFVPEAAGSGIPQVLDAVETGAPIRWGRLIPVKFIGGVGAIGSGMILGREGPTIHLGAAFAQLLSERVRLDQRATAHMVMAGAGAGLAAAFNAPLAGIVFVTEEMRRHFDFSFRALQAVILACLMATAVNDGLFGQGLTLRVGRFATPSLAHLWTFVPLGMLIGAAAVGFNKTLLVGLDRFGRLRRWSWLAAAVVGALVGLLIPFFPDFVGGGEKLIELNFEAPTVAIGWLLVLILARTVLFVLSYASGVPGGLFAPMLTIGTLLGLAYGEILPILKIVDLPAGVFAIAAMGALFAAVVRAPLTGIIVVVEMTGTYDLILPIIVTSLFATFTAEGLGGQPIYHLLLQRARARTAAPVQS
jgi:CIC family chloride channel protein